MTESPLRAFCVTLNFGEGGPLATNIWVAPDEAAAVALHVVDVLRKSGTDKPLLGCVAQELSGDQLRHLVRAVEGKLPPDGKAEVLSLVPKSESPSPFRSPLAGYLHQADPPGIETFTGPRWIRYGEPFGPPMPEPPVAS